MARAVGTSLSISTKHAIEICNLIRHKQLSTAKDLLKKAITKEAPIPFTRFNRNVGHRPGIGPGRYPEKASKEILGLLECVEANAQFKGLDTSSLVIEHICAQRASKAMRYGRKRGVRAKRTHVEVMVKEAAKKEPKKTDKAKPKAEPKKEAAKEQVKKVEEKKTAEKTEAKQ